MPAWAHNPLVPDDAYACLLSPPLKDKAQNNGSFFPKSKSAERKDESEEKVFLLHD